MYRICVFAGTTEGRKLVEFLSAQPVSVTACVATEYGEAMLEESENLTINAARLSPSEIEVMLLENSFDLLVDATHPYARKITENLRAASAATSTEYIRLLRDKGQDSPDAVFVDDTAAAVAYLNSRAGNILLTTGSKDLLQYSKIKNFTERVYVRVLPMTPSLNSCREAGVKASHIIAMQGPFTEEMNIALLNSISAKYIVTKDGGETGGFTEKVSAAEKAGAKIIVIGRPAEEAGLSLSETIKEISDRFGLTEKPAIRILGIGPGSCSAMTNDVLSALEAADCLIGAERMLDAVKLPGQASYTAIDADKIAEYISNHPEYHHFAVVLSGDPGFFSGAKRLLPLLEDFEPEVLPGISSLVYFCSRLQTSYENVVPYSVHGRDNNIINTVRRNQRVFALTGGEDGMQKLCASLVEAGLAHVKMSIGERLSYPDEKITTGTAGELFDRSYKSLSVALIETEETDLITTHGLPDEAFLRGRSESGIVPMSKSEVRSVCLSKLELRRNSICWDIGAGTGSVAIEMALQADQGQVYAIERKREAIQLLESNRDNFSLSNISVIHGSAPEACADLPVPTHVFIGGSAGNMRSILSRIISKNLQTRIVASAISLESIAELTACMKEFDFEIQEVVSLTVARSKRAGEYKLMKGHNPIYIFTMQNAGGY